MLPGFPYAGREAREGWLEMADCESVHDPKATSSYVTGDVAKVPNNKAMNQWLADHGIASKDVPVPGWVECTWKTNTITYTSYVRDAAGVILTDEGGVPLVVVKAVQPKQVKAWPVPTGKQAAIPSMADADA